MNTCLPKVEMFNMVFSACAQSIAVDSRLSTSSHSPPPQLPKHSLSSTGLLSNPNSDSHSITLLFSLSSASCSFCWPLFLPFCLKSSCSFLRAWVLISVELPLIITGDQSYSFAFPYNLEFVSTNAAPSPSHHSFDCGMFPSFCLALCSALCVHL